VDVRIVQHNHERQQEPFGPCLSIGGFQPCLTMLILSTMSWFVKRGRIFVNKFVRDDNYQSKLGKEEGNRQVEGTFIR
jgi:hypothetical protein